MGKIFFTVVLLFIALLITLNFKLPTKPVSAQSCQSGDAAEGLISAQSITGNFGNTSQTCQIDPKSIFVSYKIPTYQDLLTTYYTKAKQTATIQKVSVSGNATQANLNFSPLDTLLYISGDLDISGPLPPSSNKTAVVFIDDNLHFQTNYTYGTSSTGTVFVVGGNVNIDTAVTTINATIISSGVVCTAFESGSCPAGLTNPLPSNQRLVINGSLISLSENPIKFRRDLVDNTNYAAEQVNQDPKYLVILRDLFSQTLQKWAEFAGDSAPSVSINCSSYSGNQLLCENKGCRCSGAACATCIP